jgi:hypothetical protein
MDIVKSIQTELGVYAHDQWTFAFMTITKVNILHIWLYRHMMLNVEVGHRMVH